MLPVAHGDVLRIGASRKVKPGYEAEANYEKSLVSHTKGAPPVKTSKTKETFAYQVMVMVLTNLVSRSRMGRSERGKRGIWNVEY